MRIALLLLLAAGCINNEHTISGTYTASADGAAVTPDGSGTSQQAVVEVTVKFDGDGLYDHAYFTSATPDGTFAVRVRDGAKLVRVYLKDHTGNFQDVQREFDLPGPVLDDVDLGHVDFTR